MKAIDRLTRRRCQHTALVYVKPGEKIEESLQVFTVHQMCSKCRATTGRPINLLVAPIPYVVIASERHAVTIHPEKEGK